MSEENKELLRESKQFSRGSNAVYIKFSPKVNPDGTVYISPIESDEKPLSYGEIRKAVLDSRKI